MLFFHIIIGIFSISAIKADEEPAKKYCTTQACNETVNNFLLNMNKSVDPCDDFFQYACGGFVNRTVIPDGKRGVNIFTKLIQKLDKQLKTVLEVESSSDEIKPFKLARDFYRSCVNETQIEVVGLTPLNDTLFELGGWFNSTQNATINGTKYEWLKDVTLFRKNGYSMNQLIAIKVGTDLKNSSVRTLVLDRASLGLDRDFLVVNNLSDKRISAYFEYMKDSAQLLGHNTTEIEEDLKAILEFEIKLANITKTGEERRNITNLYNKMSISNLTDLNPCVPWLQYINAILTSDIIQVNGSQEIIVYEPGYIKDLYGLMKNTSLTVVNNYVRWMIVKNSLPNLNEAARNISNKFTTEIHGASGNKNRSESCIKETIGELDNAVGSMYVRHFFKNGSREDIKDMITQNRKTFYQMLNESDWMTNNTKTKAIEKLLAMFEHVGYPSEYLDNDTMIKRYAGLDMDDLSYFKNGLNISRFNLDFDIKLLNETVNKTSWITHGFAATVGAFYSRQENSLIFPAGILQGMFYSARRPRYINLGAIGWIIGHEISHGFDDSGRLFDKNGDLNNWWDNITEQRYKSKAQCFIDQYGNYTVESVNVTLDGKRTLGENIADNVGIRDAYLTFLAWINNQTSVEEIEYLPGFNYTLNQAFWISAANNFCTKMINTTEKFRAERIAQSPEIYRIIGSFSNQPEFSKDFNCSAGSKMNRTNKCKLW